MAYLVISNFLQIEKAMQLLLELVRSYIGLLSNGNLHPFLPGLVTSNELSFRIMYGIGLNDLLIIYRPGYMYIQIMYNTTNVKNMHLHPDSNPGPWNTVISPLTQTSILI